MTAGSSGWKARVFLVSVCGAAALSAYALLGARPAAATEKVAVVVTINGQRVDNPTTPIKVDSAAPLVFKVSVNNQSAQTVNVGGLSFEGHVVGLPVFRCDALMTLAVEPSSGGEQEFQMDNKCLKDQATGLVPAMVTVTDAQRAQLAKWNFDVSISGSLKGIYGIFGIALAVISILSILGGLISLARHRLSPNRWSRAMRFAIPGIGLGFTIVFVLGATGVASPDATSWIPIVIGSFAVLGLFGYLSPGPDEPEDIALVAQAGGSETLLMPSGAAMTAPMPQAGQPTQAMPQPNAGQAVQGQPVPGQPGAPGQPTQAMPPPVPPPAPPPSQTVRRVSNDPTDPSQQTE